MCPGRNSDGSIFCCIRQSPGCKKESSAPSTVVTNLGKGLKRGAPSALGIGRATNSGVGFRSAVGCSLSRRVLSAAALLLWQRSPITLSKLHGFSYRRALFLCEAAEGRAHGRGRASFQELAGRRPQQQHVGHTGRAGEHHVQVQPPGVIVGTSLSPGFLARTVNGHLGADRLSLRSRRGEVVGVREHEAEAGHGVRHI